MTRFASGFVIVLTAAALLTPPAAATGDRGWHLRFNYASFDPDGRAEVVEPDGEREVFDITTGNGAGGSGEYRFGRRLGLELGAMYVSATNIVVRVSGPDGDSAGHDYTVFRPFLVGLNVHLTPSSRVDVYLGPLVGYVFYDDITLRYGSETGRYQVDDDFTFGAALGLDLFLGAERHWSLNASLRVLETAVEGVENGDEPFALDYDPIIVGFGFGYRF